MTERNLPSEDPQGSTLWLDYYLQKLEDAKLPIERLSNNLAGQWIGYRSDSPTYLLMAISSRPSEEVKRLNSPASIDDSFGERLVIRLGTLDQNVSLRFDVEGGNCKMRSDKAELTGIAKASIPWTKGIDYDVYEMIDQLVDLIKRDYS